MIAVSVTASWLVIAGVTAVLVTWFYVTRRAFDLIARRLAQPAPEWAGTLIQEKGTSESQ